MNALKIAAVASLLGLAVGCGGKQYSDARPPVESLTEGDTGLQSKDVVAATDHMANDLLALPDLNASGRQWTIVLNGVQNNTGDPTMRYDVFSSRLRPLILSRGRGRVTMIENKQQYHDIQNKEVEGAPDPMGQGGGGTGQPIGIQPDYGLSIVIDRMPNNVTDYYLVNATLTNLKNRTQVWANYPPYEIKAAR